MVIFSILLTLTLTLYRSVFGFGKEDEECIGVLNVFFYPDGAKLHDIGCQHRKPVLCET